MYPNFLRLTVLISIMEILSISITEGALRIKIVCLKSFAEQKEESMNESL